MSKRARVNLATLVMLVGMWLLGYRMTLIHETRGERGGGILILLIGAIAAPASFYVGRVLRAATAEPGSSDHVPGAR